MTAVTLLAPFNWPGFIDHMGNNPSLGTQATLDAAGEYWTFVFCASQAMTISHVVWRTGAAVGSPTVDIRIETVGTDGLPSGSLWATNTNIVTGALSSTTTSIHALTASASIAKGQMVAVKIAYVSGTSIVVANVNNFLSSTWSIPYMVTNVGTPTKARLQSKMPWALGSGATTFYHVPGLIPVSAITSSTFNNTNAAARGLRFQTLMDCRLVGSRLHMGSSTGDFNMVLYNDAGTELSTSSTAFDGDHSGGSALGYFNIYFDNAISLTKNTWYRMAIEPSSATNCIINTLTIDSIDYMSATPFDTKGHWTTRASAVWDDTNTTIIPLMELIIDQVDDGAGTGGGGGGGIRLAGHGGLAA